MNDEKSHPKVRLSPLKPWRSAILQEALAGIAVAATPDDERKFELEGGG